jgi:hypothetical protein
MVRHQNPAQPVEEAHRVGQLEKTVGKNCKVDAIDRKH